MFKYEIDVISDEEAMKQYQEGFINEEELEYIKSINKCKYFRNYRQSKRGQEVVKRAKEKYKNKPGQKEKIKEYQKEYQANYQKTYQKIYYQKNRERILEQKRLKKIEKKQKAETLH